MRKFLLFTTALLLSYNANAEEPKDTNGLRVNLKRIALDVSSTEVKNSDQYQNSSVSELSADSESIVKGVFDGALEYEQPKYRWDQKVYLAYGKTKTKPLNAPHISNENQDEILLTSEYTHKMWKYEEADVGPFASLGYQTEFTENNNAPRQKIIRGKGGIRLFNGEYFSNLHIAGVGESDQTYSESNEKFAMEIGAEAKYPLREGVDFKFEGYYRDYLHYSRYEGSDLKYDLNLVGRMDVKVIDNISISPFVSYRMAESREATKTGSNFTTGISLSYANIFDLMK